MFLYALLLAVCVAAVQLDPTLNYTVTLAGGKVSGCNPLDDMLSNRGCGTDNLQDLWNVDDGTGNQHYHFVPVPGLTNTFNVITSCQKYLSCQACSGDDTIDLFGLDDGSGRQRWLLTPVDGEANTYTFQVAGGRDASCGIFMSTGSQCTDTYVNLFTSDDGSGRQRWVITPVQVPSGGSSSSPTSSSSTASFPTSSSSPGSSSSNPSSSSQKTNVGAIVGGVVGGILLLLLLACILFFVRKRPNRNRDRDDSDVPSQVIPYMLAQTTEPGAESSVVMPSETTSNSTPWRPTEKRGRVTAAPGGGRPGWNSGSSSRRMSESTATAPRSGSSSEAAELRNEVDNIRREMAEMRVQREYDMQPPPMYGQIS